MKLAVRKEEGQIHGAGYHYFLAPHRLTEPDAAMWGLLGWHIVEVDDARGERLIREAGEALRHQFEIACLADAPKGGDQPPTA